jgi:hypothetical protein
MHLFKAPATPPSGFKLQERKSFSLLKNFRQKVIFEFLSMTDNWQKDKSCLGGVMSGEIIPWVNLMMWK